jgi:hypothetical protein
VQTLAAQAGALVFVIGSYFLAELVRKRRVRRPRAAPPERVEQRGESQPLESWVADS